MNAWYPKKEEKVCKVASTWSLFLLWFSTYYYHFQWKLRHVPTSWIIQHNSLTFRWRLNSGGWWNGENGGVSNAAFDFQGCGVVEIISSQILRGYFTLEKSVKFSLDWEKVRLEFAWVCRVSLKNRSKTCFKGVILGLGVILEIILKPTTYCMWSCR